MGSQRVKMQRQDILGGWEGGGKIGRELPVSQYELEPETERETQRGKDKGRETERPELPAFNSYLHANAS